MSESYHSRHSRATCALGRRASTVFRAAARELIRLIRFEFLAGDPELGLALAQLQLYLLRISEGHLPFDVHAFLQGLRAAYRFERLAREAKAQKPKCARGADTELTISKAVRRARSKR